MPDGVPARLSPNFGATGHATAERWRGQMRGCPSSIWRAKAADWPRRARRTALDVLIRVVSDGRTPVNYVFGAAKHNRPRRALRAGYVTLRLRRQIELSPGASPADTDEADLLAVPDTLPDFAPWVKLLSAQGDRREEV